MRLVVCSLAAIMLSACSGAEDDLTDAGGGSADAGESDGGRADAGLAPPPEVCPRPQTDVARGDINGDGVVDVADPIAFENYLFHDIREPVCREAADVNDDALIELDDATVIVSYLVVGTQDLGTPDPNDCGRTTPWPEGQCAPFAIDLEAPARVNRARFDAKVHLRNPTLAVQGWSLSIRATDCTISGVTTQGTKAAEVWDDPPGIRHLGYSAEVAVDGGAIAYVTLSVTSEVSLPASHEASAILALEVGTVVPASGCQSCVLSVADDLVWTGQPIDAVIVADGYAYKPSSLPSKTIEVCAP